MNTVINNTSYKHLFLTLMFGVFLGTVCSAAVFLYARPHVTTVRDVVDAEAWVKDVLQVRYKVPAIKSGLVAKAIVGASLAENIPVQVIMAQINVESSYKADARGKNKEIGYMQVKEKYWKKECRRYNIRDRYENIYAGACALRWNLDRTSNMNDALVAYNIGINDFDNQVDIMRGFVYRDKVMREYKHIEGMLDVRIDTL